MTASIHFTARELAETFGVDIATAKVAQQWLHECCNRLECDDYHGHHSHLIAQTMTDISKHFGKHFGKQFGGYGVEGFLFDGVGEGVLYINQGNTYRRTLVWTDESAGFELTSWGDIVEDRNARESSSKGDEGS